VLQHHIETKDARPINFEMLEEFYSQQALLQETPFLSPKSMDLSNCLNKKD